MAFGKVTEENVYTCTGHPLESDIANILDWMLNQDFSTAYRSILVPLLALGFNPHCCKSSSLGPSITSCFSWAGCCSLRGGPWGCHRDGEQDFAGKSLELRPLLARISEITELKTLKGLALQDILTEIHLFVHRGRA